jgi:serine/threonine protein kinase
MEDPLSFDSFPEANEAWDPSQLEVLDDQPPLGAGAMGIVYRGWYRGRSVAVKAITEVHRNNPKLISLFTREAQISCDCKHPNVVSTFGFDPEKMLLCIGMFTEEGGEWGGGWRVESGEWITVWDQRGSKQ